MQSFWNEIDCSRLFRLLLLRNFFIIDSMLNITIQHPTMHFFNFLEKREKRSQNVIEYSFTTFTTLSVNAQAHGVANSKKSQESETTSNCRVCFVQRLYYGVLNFHNARMRD